MDLDAPKGGELNQSLKRGKTMIKRDVTYTYNDSDFKPEESDNTYKITRTHENSATEYGSMHKLAKGDLYIMTAEDGISVSYFNKDVNMVSKTYNNEQETVTILTSSVRKDPEMK